MTASKAIDWSWLALRCPKVINLHAVDLHHSDLPTSSVSFQIALRALARFGKRCKYVSMRRHERSLKLFRTMLSYPRGRHHRSDGPDVLQAPHPG